MTADQKKSILGSFPSVAVKDPCDRAAREHTEMVCVRMGAHAVIALNVAANCGESCVHVTGHDMVP